MGGSVSNEELVGFVATLAGLVDKNIERAGKLDEQAKRSLDQMVKGNEALQKQILAIADDVRAKYAPAAVEETAKAGKEAIDELKDEANRAAETIRLAASVGIEGIQAARREWKGRLKVGAACLLAGLLASPFVARTLSPNQRSQVAAVVMDTDRWSAGHQMLMLGDPAQWVLEEGAVMLQNANAKAIEKCRDLANEQKAVQHCTVDVFPSRKAER